MVFKLFGGVNIKFHFYAGVHLQRNGGVHIKSEMEAFIRFRGVYLHVFFWRRLSMMKWRRTYIEPIGEVYVI